MNFGFLGFLDFRFSWIFEFPGFSVFFEFSGFVLIGFGFVFGMLVVGVGIRQKIAWILRFSLRVLGWNFMCVGLLVYGVLVVCFDWWCFGVCLV